MRKGKHVEDSITLQISIQSPHECISYVIVSGELNRVNLLNLLQNDIVMTRRIQNPVELVISCSFGNFITPFKALDCGMG
jgi:hypothetical protein